MGFALLVAKGLEVITKLNMWIEFPTNYNSNTAGYPFTFWLQRSQTSVLLLESRIKEDYQANIDYLLKLIVLWWKPLRANTQSAL